MTTRHTGTLNPTPAPRAPKVRSRPPGSGSLFDSAIARRAALDALRKLDPRTLARNPVMFVVEVGSVLTTILFFRDLGDSTGDENLFAGLVVVFLWFTVLFANFAEAMAEGRGKAQAATLRKTRGETVARVRRGDGSIVEVASSQLDLGDECVVTAGEVIPGDGDVIEGIATVDESAITGESAPVIRESGGDRSAVTGGTRVLSDEIVVRITAEAGRDVPRSHDRSGRGRRSPEDAERDRAVDPARRPDDHLLAGGRDPATVRHLLRRRTVDHRPRRAARVPDPDHDRRSALGDRDRRDGSPRPAQRAGDVGARRRGGWRRDDAAARQDGDHHVRRSTGGRAAAGARGDRTGAGGGGVGIEHRRRDAGGSIDRRVRGEPLRLVGTVGARRRHGPVHRPDPNEWDGLPERRRRTRPAGAQGSCRDGPPDRRGRGRHRTDRGAAARRDGVARRRHAARRHRPSSTASHRGSSA